MGGIRDQRNIDEVRKRLYDRSHVPKPTPRHKLRDEPVEVATDWGEGSSARAKHAPSTSDLRRGMPSAASPASETASMSDASTDVARPSNSKSGRSGRVVGRTYRLIILGTSLFLFMLAILISSTYLYFGANQISARNIGINVSGPFAVSGGEELPLQIAVTNQNAVPIESATLIIDYPDGTRSTGEENRQLFEERLPVGDIDAGETENIPIRIALFGEENEEKEIRATIEYRVAGSNGTFYKDAEPLLVRINSSPLVLRVDAVEQVSSGQEVAVELTLRSNSANPLEDILVNASYPGTFSFVSADPSPDFGNNGWSIDRLEPRGAVTISLLGSINGFTDEEFSLNFVAGTPSSDNPFSMGSVLAEAAHDFIVEEPFLAIETSINGDTDGTAEIPAGEQSEVIITVENSLSETVYDLAIEAAIAGNVYSDESITSTSGFFDADSDTIRWEVSGFPEFQRILPGESRAVSFRVNPDDTRATAFYTVDTEVFARRVNEASATEELVGEDDAEAKFYTEVEAAREVAHDTGPFQDSGPVPPVARETTTYTLTLAATAGANEATGALVTTALPQHVEWLGEVRGDGELDFNSVSQQIRWEPGDLAAEETKTISFQVAFLPSVLQVGTTPVLMGSQELRATDAYTGVSLRSTAPAVTTELSTEAGFEEENGRVRPQGGSD